MKHKSPKCDTKDSQNSLNETQRDKMEQISSDKKWKNTNRVETPVIWQSIYCANSFMDIQAESLNYNKATCVRCWSRVWCVKVIRLRPVVQYLCLVIVENTRSRAQSHSLYWWRTILEQIPANMECLTEKTHFGWLLLPHDCRKSSHFA